MGDEMSTESREIWDNLSSIDVSKHIEKKGSLNYLSWAWAWGILMSEYPESTYEFSSPVMYENGTCEVWVTVRVDKVSRKMWLPVMDNRNKSLTYPTSRDISDTRMRCLVKCLAMFGLGHYIYAGEDIPSIVPDASQTMSGETVDQDRVQKAYGYFVKLIEKDADETEVAPRIQEAYAKLTPDEQIAVNNLLKQIKFEKRQMNTILKGFLEFKMPDGAE